MLITHYYTNKDEPYKQISIVSYKEYKEICSSFESIPHIAFKRFQNPESYYYNRINTERWLYESFKLLGGTPLIHSPYYFVLGESNYLHNCFGPNALKKQLYIPLQYSNYISFTIGDSVSLFCNLAKNQLFPTLYTYENIRNWLNDSNIELNKLQSFLDRHKKIIEVQVWNPALLSLCQIN